MKTKFLGLAAYGLALGAAFGLHGTASAVAWSPFLVPSHDNPNPQTTWIDYPGVVATLKAHPASAEINTVVANGYPHKWGMYVYCTNVSPFLFAGNNYATAPAYWSVTCPQQGGLTGTQAFIDDLQL